MFKKLIPKKYVWLQLKTSYFLYSVEAIIHTLCECTSDSCKILSSYRGVKLSFWKDTVLQTNPNLTSAAKDLD